MLIVKFSLMLNDNRSMVCVPVYKRILNSYKHLELFKFVKSNQGNSDEDIC